MKAYIINLYTRNDYLFVFFVFVEKSVEDDEEIDELPMKKRRRLALEDLSDDEEDSGDEYVPGN